MTTRSTYSRKIEDVLSEALEPIEAFATIIDGISDDVSIPKEGHPRLCAKVLGVLLDHHKRVVSDALSAIGKDVGHIQITAFDYFEDNAIDGVAGQICGASIYR